jgi:UDP-N-acetylglucosamine--N-acetylmuramyl-(pentapeptide) pyrophosphoryl-undecaprenol N-acetylglucosamine transferase
MRILIAGGGTGGHLFPALALADTLRSRVQQLSILFVGAEGGIEAAIAARHGWAFEGIRAAGLRAKRWPDRFRSIALIPFGVARSWSILSRFRPDAVIGLGGYASGPVLLAAALRRLPTIVHEQNSVPGLTNRWLASLVDLVAVGFEPAKAFFPASRVHVTGTPVRRELFAACKAAAVGRFGLDPDAMTVLVFGGSQGAHRLNEAVLEALPLLEAERARLQFLHATGPRDVARVRAAYGAHGYRAVVEPFFWEMALPYAAADLCLCRSGASTVAELCALGKAAILVPFPFAVNDHQRRNAEILVAAGAARMLLDRDLSGVAVAALVRCHLVDRRGLQEMGERARRLARPDAADHLADLVLRASRAAQPLARAVGHVGCR